MLGGSALTMVLAAPITGYAQSPTVAPNYNPSSSVENIGKAGMFSKLYTLNSANPALTLGGPLIALTGAAASSDPGITPVTAASGRTTITLNGGTITGGTGMAAGPGGSAIKLTSGELRLDMSNGGTLTAGAGAGNAVGAHAVAVSGGELIIVGASTGTASLVGAGASGTGAISGAGIDASGAVILESGNISLAAVGASDTGGALNLNSGSSLTIHAGAKLIVNTDAAHQEGIAFSSSGRISSGSVKIAGGTYRLYDFNNQGTIERTTSEASAIIVDGALTAEAALRVGEITTGSTAAGAAGLVALRSTAAHGAGSAIVFSGVNAIGSSALVDAAYVGGLTVILDKATVTANTLVTNYKPPLTSGMAPVAAGNLSLKIHDSSVTVSDVNGLIAGSTNLSEGLNASISGNSTIATGTAATKIFGSAMATKVNITPGVGNVVTINAASLATASNLVGGSTDSTLQFGVGTTNIITGAASNVLKLVPDGATTAGVVSIAGAVSLTGAGTAELTGVMGSIALQVAEGGRLDAASVLNVAAGDVNVADGGKVKVTGGGTLTENLVAAGNFVITDAPYTVTGTTAVENKGCVVAGAAGSTFTGDVTVKEGGFFKVNDGTTFGTTGTVADGGNLQLNGKLTTAGVLTLESGANLIIGRDDSGNLGTLDDPMSNKDVVEDGVNYLIAAPVTEMTAAGGAMRGSDGELTFNNEANDVGSKALAEKIAAQYSSSSGDGVGIYNLTVDGKMLQYRLATQPQLDLADGEREFLQELLAGPLNSISPDSALLNASEQERYAPRIAELLASTKRDTAGLRTIRDTIRETRPNAASNAAITVASTGERLFDMVSSRMTGARSDDLGITLVRAKTKRRGLAGAATVVRGGISSPSTWGEVFYSSAEAKEEARSAGYSAQTYGIAVGADIPILRRARVGASYGLGFTDSDGSGSADTQVETTSHSLSVYGHIDLYGLGHPGPFAAAVVGYGLNDTTGERALPTAQAKAKGSFASTSLQARIETGYRFVVAKRYAFDAYVGFRYADVQGDSYTETGAGALNLRIDSSKYSSAESVMGFRLAADIKANGVVVRPHIHGAWLHDFSGKPTEVSARFASSGANAPNFTVEGRERGEEGFSGGFGLSFHMGHRITVSIGGEATLRKNTTEIGGSGVFRYSF